MSDLETLKRLLNLDTKSMTLAESKAAWDDVEYYAATFDWPSEIGNGRVSVHADEMVRMLRLLVDGYAFLAKEYQNKAAYVACN